MGEWKNGIFGCFGDIKLCLVTYFLPCFTTGKIAEAVGMDTCFMGGCKIFIPCYNLFYLHSMREAVREKNGIDDEGIMSWVWTCCFGLCSVIQQAQEMGVDPLGQGESIERV